MTSSPGTLLSQRYEIRELIGTDGAVEVYRALDLRLGRDVALTVLDVHNLAGTDEYLRFERESQARAAMQHPRIATIHDFGHDATRIFLVAEWMEGESLRSRLSKGFLDLPQVRALGRELLDGLTEIHNKGFALGTLSTASAFLEKDGQAKLFAYRLQRIGNGSPEGPHKSRDLRNLAALLLFALPPQRERPRMKGADARFLERLGAWSANEDPVETPTSEAFQAILRESPPSPWRRRLPWITALGVLLAGCLVVPFLRRPSPEPRLTVALLPFQNLDGKREADYLGPNLLHALARDLGHAPEVRVALAGNSPGSDPATTARQMGADLALSGGYRVQNGHLFVEAFLHRARDGSLFSRCEVDHPLTDLLFLTSELEDHLRASLQGGPQTGTPPGGIAQSSQDPEAQRLCLQGLQLLGNMDPAGFEKALKCFQGATTRDPAFALAFSGLSDCYCLLASLGLHPRKEAQQLADGFARKALDLDPALAQAHASLANVRFRLGLDWVGAEAEFRQAIRLDPNYAKVHQWFGVFLATLGHWEESLEHMRRALELEPLSISCRTNYALDLHWAGRSEEAIQEFDKILDQDPSCIGALTTLWQIQEELGKLPEALLTAKRLVSLGALPEKTLAVIRDALEAQGPRGYWEQRVRQVEQAREGDPMRLAEVVALQGDRDRAFRLLDRALQEQSPVLIYIPKDPAFETLRQDPRFAQLLKRMGYPST